MIRLDSQFSFDLAAVSSSNSRTGSDTAAGVFRFTLLYSFAFAIGMAVWYAWKPDINAALTAAIADHLHTSPTGSGFMSWLSCVTNAASPHLRHIMFAFAAGFTMLAPAVLGCLLAYRGFSMGFSVGYLLSSFAAGTPLYSRFSFCLYLGISALLAAALICFCAGSSVFSEEFRRISRCGRAIFSPVLWRQIAAFLCTLGFAVILALPGFLL